MTDFGPATVMEATVSDWQKSPIYSRMEEVGIRASPEDLSGSVEVTTTDRPPRSEKKSDSDSPKPDEPETADGMATRPVKAVFQPAFNQIVWQELVDQRQALIKKKFGTGLLPAESQRIQFLEWKLDRLEMARSQESLTRLETMVSRQEAIAQSLLREMQTLQRRG